MKLNVRTGAGMPRSFSIGTAITAVLLALGAIGFAVVENDDQVLADSDLPVTASVSYDDGSATIAFSSVGELVATAGFALRGTVVNVERGDPIKLADGSGTELIPRIIVVEVKNLFHRRGADSVLPSPIRIVDGYWQDGVGHERESVGWASQGQDGFFIVSRDRAPDGTYLSTYSPLNGGGIALVEKSNRVSFAQGGVWRSLGASATPAEFREVMNSAAAAARSGAAAPVPATVCYPSVPGDENSEPICEEG